MKNKEQIELLRKIDHYIKGNLSQEEINELWKLFLQYPDFYYWFETELHLRELIKKGDKPNFLNAPSEAKIVRISGLQSWLYATAIAIVIVVGLQFFSISEAEALEKSIISSIDITELAGVDIFRSDHDNPGVLDLAINAALVTAYENNTDSAILRFRQLYNEPLSSLQKLKVEMNLGILLYNTGNFDEAITFFRSASTNTHADIQNREKNLWFLGNSYLQLRDLENARLTLHQVFSLSGRFQESSFELLKIINLQLGYTDFDMSFDEP